MRKKDEKLPVSSGGSMGFVQSPEEMRRRQQEWDNSLLVRFFSWLFGDFIDELKRHAVVHLSPKQAAKNIERATESTRKEYRVSQDFAQRKMNILKTAVRQGDKRTLRHRRGQRF